MSDEIVGMDAQGVLNNQAFKKALEKLHNDLEKKALMCDIAADDGQANKIILSKQLLRGLERELVRLVNNPAAKVQLTEVEPRKRPIQR